MRQDARMLVPLILFGLSFLAIVTGLFLLTGLHWDVMLEDVGLIESSESDFTNPLPTPQPTAIPSRDSAIYIPLPTSQPRKVVALAPTSPSAPTPTPTEIHLERRTHFPSTRTGIASIDRVVDLVLGVDDNAIRDALVFTLVGCTHKDGLGGPPKCREGEAEGTQVEVLPILGSEGHFFRQDEIEDWRGIGVVGLYAAYEVSENAFSDESYPAGKYAAVFMEADHQFLFLQIEGGGIVRIDYVLGDEPDSKIERESRKLILPPLPHGVIPSTGLGLTLPGWRLSPTPIPGGGYDQKDTSDSGSVVTPPTSSESSALFTNLIFTRYPYLRKPQVVFPNGTPYIYAVWDYAGMEDGMVLRREWYRDGELWIEREESWDYEKYGSSGSVLDISIYDFDNGLEPGRYGLNLYVDGTMQIASSMIFVTEWAYKVDPQASPDGTYLASLERPGTIFIQKWGRKGKELVTLDEVADMAWFPGGKHLFVVNVNRFKQWETSSMMVGFESWIVDIETGEKRMIASVNENLNQGIPSPGGRYIAGISGTGWGDACFYDSFLKVLKLDREHNHIATFSLEDFTGIGGDPEEVAWHIHPQYINWINRYQFTAELREHCLPSFDTGVYLFDLKTMEAKKVRDRIDDQVWSR